MRNKTAEAMLDATLHEISQLCLSDRASTDQISRSSEARKILGIILDIARVQEHQEMRDESDSAKIKIDIKVSDEQGKLLEELEKFEERSIKPTFEKAIECSGKGR